MRLARGSSELTQARLPTCSLPPALLDCRPSNPQLLLCLLALLLGGTTSGRVGCLSLPVVAGEQCWGLPHFLRAARTRDARQSPSRRSSEPGSWACSRSGGADPEGRESHSYMLREGPGCACDLSVNLGFAWLTARGLL